MVRDRGWRRRAADAFPPAAPESSFTPRPWTVAAVARVPGSNGAAVPGRGRGSRGEGPRRAVPGCVRGRPGRLEEAPPSRGMRPSSLTTGRCAPRWMCPIPLRPEARGGGRRVPIHGESPALAVAEAQCSGRPVTPSPAAGHPARSERRPPPHPERPGPPEAPRSASSPAPGADRAAGAGRRASRPGRAPRPAARPR